MLVTRGREPPPPPRQGLKIDTISTNSDLLNRMLWIIEWQCYRTLVITATELVVGLFFEGPQLFPLTLFPLIDKPSESNNKLHLTSVISTCQVTSSPQILRKTYGLEAILVLKETLRR